ncbi:hypothetical protein ciss_22530 [Carboxydothermus islandicus]|uniref:Uncharacterized protein n=2 Tax=Carboxydothermus islandicus TaxID=661089 RepID=A0A1L8D568_9THEO|nr:hypothetical protein ciss_22530 [Carboxydothermus islandicus]
MVGEIAMKNPVKSVKNETIVNLLTSIFLLHPELAAIQIDSDARQVKLKYFIESLKDLTQRLKKTEYLWKSYLDLKKMEKYTLEIKYNLLENYVMIEVFRDLNTFHLGELSFAVQVGKGLGFNYLTDEFNDVLDFIEIDEHQLSLLLENTKRSFYKTVFAFREEGRVVIAN